MAEYDKDDELFMREALKEAHSAAELGEVPIGAVVVHDGRVIARAHNRRELDDDPSAHAEFAAMMEASRVLGRWRLTGCTVYVTLEPCLMCSGLMVNARVDRCVYGAADPKGGALGTLYDVSRDARLNHSFAVASGVLADECSVLLSDFFRGLRAARKEGAASCDEGTSTPAVPHGAFGSSNGLVANTVSLAPTTDSRGCIVLAIDSFKGSATSAQAEAWLHEGMTSADSGIEVVAIPIADGGEGTMDAFRAVRGGEIRRVAVAGPDGRAREASYLMMDDGRDGPSAVIEVAQAASIAYSERTNGAALSATSYGVGELMMAAVSAGARTLYIGRGGSSTTDGGAGMLRALGAVIGNDAGAASAPGLAGLGDVTAIDIAPARRALDGIRLKVLADVAVPLVGPRGAVRMFGPQKGLGAGLFADDRERLLCDADRCMAAYGAKLTEARDALDGGRLQVGAPGARPRSLAGVPGAGAAGGMGAALVALGAQLALGADAMLDLIGFDGLARRACAVVTGEGSIDAQTAEGKVPACVARRAKAVRADLPVFAVCGSRARDLDVVYAMGIDAVFPIGMEPRPLERALDPEQVHLDLIATGETIARVIRSQDTFMRS